MSYRLNRGLGYTLLPETDLQKTVFRVSQGGVTTWVDQDTGQVMVSGIVTANGNSVPLTAQQYLDFMASGVLGVNRAVLPPQYIPGSAGNIYLGGVQQAPVVQGGNAPVTVSNPTMMPNNPALSSSTTQAKPVVISTNNQQAAPSGTNAATPWYDASMFGFPAWGLLAAGVGLAALFMTGGHRGK